MTGELVWRIAGGSGDGIDSTSQNFTKALMRSGLHVFTHRHYPSRIRGGHTYVEVRADEEPVRARGDGFNFLLALGDSFARNTKEHAYYGNEQLKPLAENLDDLREGGVVVYDEGLLDASEIEDFEERVEENDWHVYPMDLRGLARDQGREVMRNTAGVGATCALLDYPLEPIERLMEDRMSGDVLEANLEILEVAHEQANEFDHTHELRMPEGDHDAEQALVSGSNGIAYGAIDAGCRFVAGYPMTPWTEVFTLLSQHLPGMGGIAEQVEDEIAAAALALGASHAGAKALSGSSGGGFALMSEPLGLAEMTETPLVLVEATRAGPSTGMPTKTEQGDLEHVLYTSQGDSCRVVLAPGNPREAYEQTRLAFELAYDFHLPAIVLYDQKLSGELRNVDADFFDREPDPDLGKTLTEDELAEATHYVTGTFERFQHDPPEGDGGEAGGRASSDVSDGVAPRSIPGQADGRYLASGNEHHPTGHISEDPENRVAQMDRRMRKLEAIRERLDDRGSSQVRHGAADATVGVMTYGSNQGTVHEAVDRLVEDGHDVASLSVSELAPFPTSDVAEFLDSVETCLVVEMNASGQFRGLVQRELGAYGEILHSLLKYNGEPFEPHEIVEAVEGLGSGDPATAATRYVPAGSD